MKKVEVLTKTTFDSTEKPVRYLLESTLLSRVITTTENNKIQILAQITDITLMQCFYINF